MVTPGTPPIPHVGGPVLPPCMPTVVTGGMPQARITDQCLCVGPPDVITQGSPTVHVGGLMAARMGDMTAHGGVIMIGMINVLIGGGAGGGGGGGGGGSVGTSSGSSSGSSSSVGAAAIGALTTGKYWPLSQAAAMKQAAAQRAPLVERCPD